MVINPFDFAEYWKLADVRVDFDYNHDPVVLGGVVFKHNSSHQLTTNCVLVENGLSRLAWFEPEFSIEGEWYWENIGVR